MTADEAIYLDYNATTPVDDRVLAAMQPYFCQQFGNAASAHRFGAIAREAVDAAREEVAALVTCNPQEVVFTSGATESNNIALIGVADADSRRRHIVTSATEHRSVLDVVGELQRRGHEVTIVQPEPSGLITPEAVAAAARPDTALVSIMAANNELGTIAPIADLAAVAHDVGALFHTDAAQMAGKLPVDFRSWNVDLMSLSAHKLYGPKGVGALVVRRGSVIRPIMFGGGHERGLRSGTLNVPGAVGFGAACTVAADELVQDSQRLRRLKALLVDELTDALGEVEVNGDVEQSLPGTVNIRIPGVDADSLQVATPTVALSSGSACSSSTPEPSHVLLAIGMSWEHAQQCLRLSLGRFTTDDEVRRAAAALAVGVRRLTSTKEPVR